MATTLYDVIAVTIQTNTVRLLASGKTYANAEAIVNLAVMRRGVEEEFFVEVPSGMYKEGETYIGTPTREE